MHAMLLAPASCCEPGFNMLAVLHHHQTSIIGVLGPPLSKEEDPSCLLSQSEYTHMFMHALIHYWGGYVGIM